MRLGIVSDIHCNADALRLGLARMGDVDELLCVGDAIYEYRFSNEVVEILRDRRAVWVLGNHEMGLLQADTVILGHTHVQMAERVGRALVINPGVHRGALGARQTDGSSLMVCSMSAAASSSSTTSISRPMSKHPHSCRPFGAEPFTYAFTRGRP